MRHTPIAHGDGLSQAASRRARQTALASTAQAEETTATTAPKETVDEVRARSQELAASLQRLSPRAALSRPPKRKVTAARVTQTRHHPPKQDVAAIMRGMAAPKAKSA